ncbi:MAG: hypothetical protein ABJA57_00405 [Ginsengibacter sp.]
MNRSAMILLLVSFLFSCAAHRTGAGMRMLPSCLDAKIKTMAMDPSQGLPQSVTRYSYKQEAVYYMVSACCDKYNIVYDSACNIIGYPDGGLTGRGDGKMTDFRVEATEGKVVWEIGNEK